MDHPRSESLPQAIQPTVDMIRRLHSQKIQKHPDVEKCACSPSYLLNAVVKLAPEPIELSRGFHEV